MTCGFSDGSRNFRELLSVSCEFFILHRYARIHGVAKFCITTAHRWLLRGSHPSLRTLWSAVIKCSVLREVNINTVFAPYHFFRRCCFWFTRRGFGCVPEWRNSFVHEILCEIFQPFQQIAQRVSPYLIGVLMFSSVLGFSVSQRVSPCLTACTLTMKDRRNVDFSEFCSDDVEDVHVVELEEPVENPGTKNRHVVFRAAAKPSAMFNRTWYLTTGPLIAVSVTFAEFPKREHCRHMFEELYCHEQIRFFDIHCCILICLHFPIGWHNRCWFWDTCTVSNLAAFKPLLRSMCIDAPEPTTNSLSHDSLRMALGDTNHQ